MAYKNPEDARKYAREYYRKNRRMVLEKAREYQETNREKIQAYNKKYQKKYYAKKREVIREKHQKYREENRERERVRHLKYSEENREFIREQYKKFYAANRERTLVKNRKWREKNLELHRELVRNWNHKHPEERRILGHNRRAHIKGNGGELPPDAAKSLFTQQSGLCYLCNEPFPKLNDPASIEHKTPVSRGGSNDISNIGLAHLSCNIKKSTKTPDEFFEWLAAQR